MSWVLTVAGKHGLIQASFKVQYQLYACGETISIYAGNRSNTDTAEAEALILGGLQAFQLRTKGM